MNNDLKAKWEALAERYDQIHAKPDSVIPEAHEGDSDELDEMKLLLRELVREGDSDELKLFLRALVIPRDYRMKHARTYLSNDTEALMIHKYVRSFNLWRFSSHRHGGRKFALKLLESRPLTADKMDRIWWQLYRERAFHPQGVN